MKEKLVIVLSTIFYLYLCYQKLFGTQTTFRIYQNTSNIYSKEFTVKMYITKITCEWIIILNYNFEYYC